MLSFMKSKLMGRNQPSFAKNEEKLTYGVSGQAVLPFAIWLHSGLFYSYPTFVSLV